MAAAGDVCAGLLRHKTILLRELIDTNILDVLVKKGLFNLNDHETISSANGSEKCNYFVEVVSKQSSVKLVELCSVLERECPKLYKELINDRHRFIVNGYSADSAKENMVMSHNLNRESPRSRRSVSQCSCNSVSRRSSTAASPLPLPPLNNTVEMYVEPVVEDTAERSAGWETHRVRLNRVPGYGFGIAVSGGRDNPHFASGDPSIAVSDVLRGGPAEDKLQVNDRIVSVNGVPLENVEYARAVQVLRDSGASVSLVVRRRAPAPPPTAPTTIKLALTRNGKKEDFGIVLGCKLYVKELTLRAREQLNQSGQGLCEGDVVTRINNTSVSDAMTLKEARKLVESCKDRLNLVVTRELIREETVTNGNYQNNYNSLNAEPLSAAYSGQNLYVAAPVRGGGEARRGPLSPHELPHDQPPRPPPPRNEDYYSSRRQLYEEDGMTNQRHKPPSEPRLISFQKEGSVGLRLCGGNRSGVFVSGVQPASPAALQGLQPADKILKVNDMEMKGVTREEAVLFLLSLQERIDLIVLHSPDEYNAVASGQMPGDSFHIKTHFHYSEPTDGEMSFRCGDVFHVVDTLHNGTVGAWQVFRIGRNNQEVQKGTIPNKARAEELATAQFNATKKELSGNDVKHNFFRRRRSTHRRSKSLGKEHWDEVVITDSISKFPAYERVALRQPGFVRPVVLQGAVADAARERLLRDHADRFAEPQMDNSLEDNKSKSTSIIRLSSIRSIMERGKHALVDITPNAVDRLNYAQFYPIVIFLKADNKHIIKQLRAGLPKSAHKSSKKLLEQCQHMERVWGHVFTHTITLSEANQGTWFNKLTELVQRTQQQQLWVSETKRPEPISDDFLFSMSSSTENRLSYASSPESDLEVSPPPAPRLVKSSSDPSIATTQDNMDRDDDLSHMVDAVPPPYTSGYGDSKYGFSSNSNGPSSVNTLTHNSPNTHMGPPTTEAPPYQRSPITHSPPQSPLYGTVPELPPRGPAARAPAGGVLLPAPPPARPPHALPLRHNAHPSNRPSAQERLFGPPSGGGGAGGAAAGEEAPAYSARPTSMIIQPTQQGSLDRHRHAANTQSSYDGTPYEYSPSLPQSTASGSGSLVNSNSRLGPNAPDDLKVAPPGKFEPPPPPNPTAMSANQSPQRNSNSHEHNSLDYRNSDPTYRSSENYRSPNPSRPLTNGNAAVAPMHARGPSLPNVGGADYAKFSGRTNSASTADYARGGAGPAAAPAPAPPYKPVPPPKPKHYRPPDNGHHAPRNGSLEPPPGARANGYAPYYAHQYQHAHSQSQPTNHYPSSQQYPPQQNMYGGQMPPQSPPYSGPPSHHRAINLPHNPHLIDLAGSREQRGSAFELYRKPQHMHNLSSSDAMNSSIERDANFSPKTKKKLSKKPSFIKNAVLDLFRSKSKNSQKVSRQKSLCESDLQHRKQISNPMPMLRREKSDVSELSVHMRNTQIRNQMLQRSNSSCEKPNLKPILKRQSSFCDERSGVICTVRDYDAKPIVRNLRRQNSMCEMETEPKVTPLLRRQNSLIEYNRRGIYGQVPSFNLITKIDPIYQRQQQMKHEPFHPTQPLPPEPVNQTKDHIVYDPIPKPRRTYASVYGQCRENPYATRAEVSNQSFESPYGNRQTLMMPSHHDPPYTSRAECARESPYASRNEVINANTYTARGEVVIENPYATRSQLLKESPYATRNEMITESPYASRNEMLKESPYASRNEILKETPYATRNEMIKDCSYATRNEMIKESPYATRNEMIKDSPYATRNEMIKESPYATRDEMLKESPYATRNEVIESHYAMNHDMSSKHSESLYGESSYSSKEQMLRQRMSSESPYSTKEEMLRQRFSESPYNTKEEMLKQRLDISNNSLKEPLYGKRTYDPPNISWSENPYGVKPERRLQTPVNFPGRIFPMSKCMSEPPYATRTEMMARLSQTESPYATRLEVKSSCSDSYYGSGQEMMELRQEVRPASAECTYVSKQEILSQKAALLASRETTPSIKLEDKLEIIKQRNQAKKELIYQTRRESNESDTMKIREPIYVSKRELKESVIYESHQETKETAPIVQEKTPRDSPYELSDANHLSRREPIDQTNEEAQASCTASETFKEIDFSTLRLNECQTDSEKERNKKLESSVLKGEVMYSPRLHGKADHISNVLKTTVSPIPYESTSSMETHYASECSMNFENKPQSTPYTSQDVEDKTLTKPSRTVTFCEDIAERSQETSQENSDNISTSCNETTLINNQNTIVDVENAEAGTKTEVEPETPNTTWGIFDSEGGVLEDRQWGVSLIIPPKAIAPGIKQKIYFTVSDPRLSQRVGGPPIDMDNGEAMLSPLVMCGPQGLVFLRPVTLRIPHCANAVPSLGLTIKATDTEAHLTTDWDHIHLPATTTLNTVAVKVDHF